MQEVTPQVYLIGETKIETESLGTYLEQIGAPEWSSNAPSDGEKLIEFMGRACYKSFAPKLNPNVTRVRKGNDKYLGHIFDVGHGSVTEHHQTNWIFHNVSRVFTHELVRHRVGVAISQESLRYVRLDALRAWMPPEIAEDEWAAKKFEEVFDYLSSVQKEMAEHFDIENIKNFGVKKKLTSAFRRMAPIGLATSIGWSANIRTLRHVIEMRTDPAAEVEIRLVFNEVAKIAKERWPNCFADYEVIDTNDGLHHWKTTNRKV